MSQRVDDEPTVTISIDFELGWGLRDLPAQRAVMLSTGRREETRYLDALLKLCEELSLPMTFATVGRLLDPDGRVTDSLDRPSDECLIDGDKRSEAASLYHASDLYERLREQSVNHEIGTHTFSHVLCDEATTRTLDAEFEAVRQLHDELGLDPPRSFVAPRNRLPENDVLTRNGIETVRVAHPSPAVSTSGQMANVVRTQVGSVDPLTHPPSRDGPLTKVVSTPFPSLTALYLPTGQANAPLPFRPIPLEIRQRTHEQFLKRKLRQVCESGGDLHLWSHLFNLANRAQWRPIEAFLRELARYREQGLVTVRTMGHRGQRRRRLEA